MFGIKMFRIRILESRPTLSNNQSRATLWVLDTCLIVGLRPFIIILIAASLSSKTYSIALEPICVTLDGTWSDQDWCAWLESVFACLVECLPTSFPVALLHLWFCWFGLMRNEILQSPNPTQRSRAGIPSMRKPASREITSASVELCETEVSRHLLMLIFESSKVSCKIRVLKQSQSALLCCVSHITILPVFTCVMMNVRDQTC